MSQLNCEDLIPPFVEHLVAKARSFDSIVSALDERATNGGIIIHRWWEDGTKQRIVILKELDDLRNVKATGNAYLVIPQNVVDRVAEWDRKLQLGDEWYRQIREREAAEALTAKHRLAVMDFSPRVLNALNRNGLEYVEDLLGMTNDEILALRNFGRASYDELRTLFINHGFADPSSEEIRFIEQPTQRRSIEAFSKTYGEALANIEKETLLIDKSYDDDEDFSTIVITLKEALGYDPDADEREEDA